MCSPLGPSQDDLRRLPGLFRRWELADVLAPGQRYQIEAAGAADDGTPLFAVFAGDGALPRVSGGKE